MPNLKDSCEVSGRKKNNTVFVSTDDLCTCLGAEIVVSGSIWLFTRNNQKIKFTLGSKEMLADISYGIYDYATSGPAVYSFKWTSVLPEAPFIENGKKYVPAELAAMQMGALITGVKNSIFTIFDFRVKNKTPLEDTNNYVVGGSWITNWNAYASHKLAPHFKISEIYSKNSKYDGFQQLKISVSLLSSLEAVRHEYWNDQSLTLASVFRSWAYNKGLSGWDRSFHMRGRAYDIASGNYGGTELYDAVYKEFCGTKSTPESIAGFWRTRTSGASLGYEIETMPRNDITWLHLQVKPGFDYGNEA